MMMARSFNDLFKKYDNDPLPQREKRSHHQMVDQFGRAWQTTIDITAKPKPAPCGPIAPLDFRDPLNTPDKFKRFNPDEMFRLTIDVDAWIKEWSEANADWEKNLTFEARKMSPADDGSSLIATMSPVLLNMVGGRPQPVEYPMALKGGNRWALGHTTDMPEWAKGLWHRMLINTGWFITNQDTIQDVEKLKLMFPDADTERELVVAKSQRESMERARQAKAEKAEREKIDREQAATA